MPVKGFLSEEQQKKLQKELKEHEHPEIRERILILLLLNDGKTQIDLLLKIVDREPEELGYEFGRWTAKRLATYLEKKTGIKLSSSQIRRNISKKKIRLPLGKI